MARRNSRAPRAPRLATVVAALDELAPPQFAADWDNVGLLVGDHSRTVSRVLFAIDLMPAVVNEAIAMKAQLIVAYHPPIFRPLKRLVEPTSGMEAGVIKCLEKGIAIYSPHTALDVADGGTNDVLADIVGIAKPQPVQMVDEERGQGRMGELSKPTTLGQLAKRIKRKTGARCVSAVGALETPVRRAIVGVGAAGNLLFDGKPGFGDVVITGEMRHHDALRVLREKATALVLSHWSSERPALSRYASRLGELIAELDLQLSEEDTEPFVRV